MKLKLQKFEYSTISSESLSRSPAKYYDITDDFCKLIQNHPVYGKKYFNTFIEMGTKNLENTIAASRTSTHRGALNSVTPVD